MRAFSTRARQWLVKAIVGSSFLFNLYMCGDIVLGSDSFSGGVESKSGLRFGLGLFHNSSVVDQTEVEIRNEEQFRVARDQIEKRRSERRDRVRPNNNNVISHIGDEEYFLVL